MEFRFNCFFPLIYSIQSVREKNINSSGGLFVCALVHEITDVVHYLVLNYTYTSA